MRIRRYVLVGLLVPCCAVPAIAQDGPQERPITVVETPPPPRTTSRVAQSLVDRGVRLLNSNQQQQAVDEFDAAIAIDPDIVWAWSNRGMALAQLNRPVEAEESFDRADALEPGNVVALRGRGFLALRGNRNAEAVDYLTRSLEIEPGSAFALFYRSGARFMLGDHAGALADNDAALLASPTWFLPYGSRASMLMMLGRREEAVAAVDAMLAAFPDAPYATAAAIQFLGSLGEDERAEALLAAGPGQEESAVMLYTRAQRRPVDETDIKLAELNRALELEPDYVQALALRSETLWGDYEYEAALADARRVIELVPAQPFGYTLAARVLIELNRRTETRRMVDALLASRPDDTMALTTASQVYRMLGDNERADELLDRMVDLGANSPMQLSALLQRLQNRPFADLEGRASDTEAVLAIDPDNVQGLYSRAAVEVRRELFPAAVVTYQRIIAIEGEEAINTTNLAMALSKAGMQAEAEAAFDQARSLAATANDLNSICWNKVINNMAIDRALEECRASLAMLDHTATRDSLAMALLRNGELDEALREFDAVLEKQELPTSQFGRAITRAQLGDLAGARRDAAAARRGWAEVDSTFAEWDFVIPTAIEP